MPIWAIFYFRSVNNSASNKEITHLDNSILELKSASQEENTYLDNFILQIKSCGRSREKTEKRVRFGFSEATPRNVGQIFACYTKRNSFKTDLAMSKVCSVVKKAKVNGC